MKTNTLFQVRFKPSVKPPRGFTKSAHYNVKETRNRGKQYLIGCNWFDAKDFIKIEIEDAPVFKKPPLRKIASLKHDEVIELGEHADLVLKQAYKEGHVWPNGSFNLDFSLPKDACLRVFEAGKIMWDHKLNYDNYNLTILPASKFVEVAAEAEPITQAQKDECLKLQERIKELEALCELRQQDIDCLCEDNEAKIEENTELSKRIDELRDICLVASNTGSKAIMYSVLRAIANGEI